MIGVYTRQWREAMQVLGVCVAVTVISLLFSLCVIPFNMVWIQLSVCILLIVYLLWRMFESRIRNYMWIAVFAMGSIAFFHMADYALNNVLEDHQRTRINVLLGMEEDLKGAGYNVHQSEIAIGSGGLLGKGFLNGTQTKLKYVPEQDTDFIFCTVGEEEGFVVPDLDITSDTCRRASAYAFRAGLWLLRVVYFPVPCLHQCGHGAGTDACHRHPVAILQLWRLVAVGLHLPAVYLPPY